MPHLWVSDASCRGSPRQGDFSDGVKRQPTNATSRRGCGLTDNGRVTDALNDLPGWTHVYSGKVRDLYRPSTPDHVEGRLLVVASDRVSAFDHVLAPGIPGKGELLTTLSLWWFDQLAGADGGRSIPNHLAADHTLDGDDRPETLIPTAVAGRAMVVRALDMLPVECVVRGYLTGSGWREYRASQTVCGIALPAGLTDGDRLPEPIFTPAYKAPLGEHDENISFDETAELVGAERATEIAVLGEGDFHVEIGRQHFEPQRGF